MACPRVDTTSWPDVDVPRHSVFVFNPQAELDVEEFLDSDEATGRVMTSSLTLRNGRYGIMYWFDDPDTAFAFKMRFG